MKESLYLFAAITPQSSRTQMQEDGHKLNTDSPWGPAALEAELRWHRVLPTPAPHRKLCSSLTDRSSFPWTSHILLSSAFLCAVFSAGSTCSLHQGSFSGHHSLLSFHFIPSDSVWLTLYWGCLCLIPVEGRGVDRPGGREEKWGKRQEDKPERKGS